MPKKHIVRLMAEGRRTCEETPHRLSGSSPKVRRARIVLHAHAECSEAWTDREIAKACRCRAAFSFAPTGQSLGSGFGIW